jgi:ACT domain-containing protein
MATKKQAKVQLGVLIYKDQMKLIDAKAKAIGLSRSAYIRYIVLKSLEK